MELEALQETVYDIENRGAQLVIVSPQRKEYLRQMAKKHGITFTMLTDQGNRVAEKFGLVYTFPDYLKELYINFGIDLERYNGDDSWTLPIPARFIIDGGAVIRSVDAEPDYTIRPEPGDIVRLLKDMF